MTSIKLTVTGASARAEVDGLLTSGMVGIPVTISYDSAWDGLTKALVCRGGSVIRTILDVGDAATVPHECMIANATLQIGVEGRNADGTLVIPTVWARCGLICSGANADADPSTDPTLPVWAQIQAMIGNLGDLETEAKNNLVDAVNEAMKNGGGEVDPEAVQKIVEDYMAANPPTVVETDPTVPEWAKQPTKPTYTAEEVAALPDTYTPPNQTAQQAGADPAGTAASAVSHHNTDATSHNDLRLALQELSDRINVVLDSDDTTLDQMSEVVAYIKSNKSMIDAITTSKVSVADIVDNLTTNASNKPLSAAQGAVIKTLIDALHNDKLDAAELTNAVNTALAQANASGEFDGADGAPGKSAYQYAVEGGYTGTETEFSAKLAQEQLTGTTNDLTPTQVYDAVSAGIPVKVQYTDSTYGLLSFTAFNVAESLNVIVSQTIVYYIGVYILCELFGIKSENVWGFLTTTLAQKTDIPSVLPNPNAITFTGAVTGTYDGSAAVTVNIPCAVTDTHINELISTALNAIGVAEDGAY